MASGSGVNFIAISGGAGREDGEGNRRKVTNGWASSPGCALITARLCRKLGTCMRTLRRKTLRTAAVAGADCAAFCNSVSCCCTLGGHAGTDCAAMRLTAERRVAVSPRLAAIRPSSTSAARLLGCAARTFSISC